RQPATGTAVGGGQCPSCGVCEKDLSWTGGPRQASMLGDTPPGIPSVPLSNAVGSARSGLLTMASAQRGGAAPAPASRRSGLRPSPGLGGFGPGWRGGVEGRSGRAGAGVGGERTWTRTRSGVDGGGTGREGAPPRAASPYLGAAAPTPSGQDGAGGGNAGCGARSVPPVCVTSGGRRRGRGRGSGSGRGGGLTGLALPSAGTLLRGAALGCTEPAAGGGDGARSFGSQRVLVEPAPAAGVAVMKFKNPPVNSLSLELLTELVISLEKLENDKTYRGVILTSGACPAGGCLISLACDYRVLADNPKYLIGLNETLLGIVAPFWLKDTLVNTIGHRAAERALQLGLLFPPAEALQVGMVDQVVPEDQVQNTALSVMAQWMAIADHARQLTKNMMRKPTADRLVKQRDPDIQNFVSFISRDSIQKSLRTYLDKLKAKKD
ncbi:hypothetical protein HPG69_000052, partial [Diceros bicornis minor]